jgi:hypothetical protein
MPWSLLTWLLCFCLQAALVGMLFYIITQLSDFEMDYINTFDAAKNVNRWVVRVEARTQEKSKQGHNLLRRFRITECHKSVIQVEQPYVPQKIAIARSHINGLYKRCTGLVQRSL